MPSSLINLDNNATTPIDPRVLRAMTDVAAQPIGNPSSRHRLGRGARRAISVARRQIASALDAEGARIVFTSGATEANNLAILGGAGPPGSHVLVSAVEHPSALAPARRLSSMGHDVEILPVDAAGHVHNVSSRIKATTSLVVIQIANSETGTIQDLAALVDSIPPSCRLHIDAVQGVGKIPLSFKNLRASTLAISGHKIHGPTGIGALFHRTDIALEPILHGGRQQDSLRPGTESIPLITGLAAAIDIAVGELPEHVPRQRFLRDMFENAVFEKIPNVLRHGDIGARLPNTSSLSFLGAPAEALLTALDLENVCASAGTACASGSLEPSPVLLAMGIESRAVKCAARFSLSRLTTEHEIQRAVNILAEVVARVRASIVDFS